MSLPLWKIKRELKRQGRQLKNIGPRLASLLFSRTYYDLFLSGKKTVTEGQIPKGPKVAVYLIFPSSGILGSHIEALRYLAQNGYAPVVVSNLPLDESDLEHLRAHAHLVIQRPNYGYDFGGYRDGVLEVTARQTSVERFVLLNDSAWFPLPGSRNWLADAEALELDFVGAATNYGHTRVDPKNFRDIRWHYSSNHRNFHYCSFALMMSGKLFNDKRFQRFWKSFPLTNDKTVTVRRGEIGLTKWVIQQGFSHGSTLDIAALDQRLAEYGIDELRAIAAQTLMPQSPSMKEVLEDTVRSAESKEDLVNVILTAIARKGISYAQPRLIHRDYGFAFLKKSPLWLDEDASNLTLAFTRDLDGEFGKVLQAEALDLRRTRAAEFAPAPD